MRFNIVVFIPLDILLQWDLQQVIALERWKHRNQKHVMAWFAALGELEAINSLSTLIFNHPEWCFPQLQEEHFFIEGKDIGHPLIPVTSCVTNPVKIEHTGELMLVTGSNMAGKSTYLRSIGVNAVLAMTGAPVCASYFKMSPVQIISSMRIADNLEESTSTFYAELKKLKIIIDKVNNNEKVFILLDEILRGTNSLDRHTGSAALIKQLIKHNAACIIATHDVELAGMKDQFPHNILNYHFDVQVSNDELYFDYRLKEGICKSLNASILMKKIGIEL
jgi:DNA mismatch repair ATPase MutS